MTQREKVLHWLRQGNPLTHDDAKKLWGVSRLAARIRDLREAGHDITTTMIRTTNRFGEECRIALYTYSKGERHG